MGYLAGVGIVTDNLGFVVGMGNAISESINQDRVNKAKAQADQEVKNWRTDLTNTMVKSNYYNQSKLQTAQNMQNMLLGRSSLSGNGLMSAFNTQTTANQRTSNSGFMS